jgi:hypothetical protein
MDDEETDTFAGLLPAEQVADVVAELGSLDEAWIREHVDDEFGYARSSHARAPRTLRSGS